MPSLLQINQNKINQFKVSCKKRAIFCVWTAPMYVRLTRSWPHESLAPKFERRARKFERQVCRRRSRPICRFPISALSLRVSTLRGQRWSYYSMNSYNLHLFVQIQNRLVYLLSVMLLNRNNPFLRLRWTWRSCGRESTSITTLKRK